MTDKKADPSEAAIQALREAIYAAKTGSLADCVIIIHPLHDLPPEPDLMFAVGTTKDRAALMVYVCIRGLQETLDGIQVDLLETDEKKAALELARVSLNVVTKCFNTMGEPPIEEKGMMTITPPQSKKPEILN